MNFEELQKADEKVKAAQENYEFALAKLNHAKKQRAELQARGRELLGLSTKEEQEQEQKKCEEKKQRPHQTHSCFYCSHELEIF